MQKIQNTSKGEPITFFCQVVTYLGVKDYLRGGRCVRLIGVNGADYAQLMRQEFGDGVTSHVLDVDLGDFVREVSPSHWSHWRNVLTQWLVVQEHQSLGGRPWLQLDVQPDPQGMSYSYP